METPSKYLRVAVRAALGDLLIYESGDLEVCVGQRVEVPLGNRTTVGYIIETHITTPEVAFSIKPITAIVDKRPFFSQKQLLIAQWIAKMSFCSLGEVLFMLGPTTHGEPKATTLLTDDDSASQEEEVSLTPDQSHVLEQIRKTSKMAYLFGVTGSGKTHVFLELVRDQLIQKKQVLYLVPEISLSYQVQKFLEKFFPSGKIALMHSGLPNTQRLKTWRDIQSGNKSIIIGTRSAILAPAENLGLIIIDEEHEMSYKSNNTPRYHARQVAMYLAKFLGVKLVMGSATPSLEAYHAMKEGTLEACILSKRISQTALPKVEIIDMRGKNKVFSAQVIHEVLKTKQQGKQSILFLNRRGFGRFYFCEDCGFELKCRHCSIAMTYHKAHQKLLCHYCGYQEDLPQDCPSCHSFRAGFSTFGLEKVEEQALQIFAGLRLMRIDGDLAKKKGYTKKVLQDFEAGNIDLLLATQIMAKGFNFPHLDLVGILNADIGMSMPDFRANERVFSLISQIIGRTGRYQNQGKVLIQTYHSDSRVILHSAGGGTTQFYDEELAVRKELFFPPYARLIQLTFRSKKQEKARESCFCAAEILNKNKPSGCEVLGPAESIISQIAGSYRWQIILRGATHRLLHQWVEHTKKDWRYQSQVYCEIDVDPVTLL